MKNRLLSEVIWLIILAGVTLLLAVFLFGQGLLRGEINFHLHDTYIIVSTQTVLLALFMVLVFIFYFFKENKTSFGRPPGNYIFFLASLALILTLVGIMFMLYKLASLPSQGWTSYPPLSRLEGTKQQVQSPVFNVLYGCLIFIQLLIISLTVYAALRRKRSPNRVII